MEPVRPRIAVSSCLLGAQVRWDGGHKWSGEVAGLSDHFELVPICPEAELGLGVPREPIEFRDGRLVGVDSGRDLTDRMTSFAVRRIGELEDLGVRGFVLKSGSPSCDVHGRAGLFARILLERLPNLPIEDEAALADPARREAFCKRVLEADLEIRTGPEPAS